MPSRRNARTAATPTARLNAENVGGASANCQPSDMQMPLPNGASQVRPRRPRPAFCNLGDAHVRRGPAVDGGCSAT